MKQLKLSQGKFALVDDEDFEKLNKYKWCINGMGRAMRSTTKPKKCIYLHRAIMNPPKNMTVDHIDGNPLNNQKNNLRICLHKNNLKNRSINKNTPCGLKGVGLNSNGKFTARIWYKKRLIHLGTFVSKEEAARAYNKKAMIFRGKYANLNQL